jgi:hypothetical protein
VSYQVATDYGHTPLTQHSRQLSRSQIWISSTLLPSHTQLNHWSTPSNKFHKKHQQ